MRKLRTLEIAKVGTWGKDGAKITKQDLEEVEQTFAGRRPVVIGHEGADDKAPKFGDVLDVSRSQDGNVLRGEVVFLEQAESLYADGYYDGWSVSIPRRGADGKRYLHHLAILGATPPKIPGLKELAAVDINYADGDAAEVIGFPGKIPEEVDQVDAKEMMAKIEALTKEIETLKTENEKLKAGSPAGGPAQKPSEESKAFADKIDKMNAELKASRVSAFSDKVGDKVPAGILVKAKALANQIGDGESFEFSDDEKDAAKKRTARPIELLGEILSAWPQAVNLGRSGNDYSDATGADGKPIDWNALASKA